MIELCKNIEDKVLPEIKSYILGKFLDQISKLSWITLYNNRRHERPDICDHEEISLQTTRIKLWLREQFQEAKKTGLLTDETRKLSTVDAAALKEFHKECESTKDNPAFINDFIEICWVDPWAADPAKPNVRGYPKSKKKKKLKNWAKGTKRALTRGLSFIDELDDDNTPVKDITIFQFPSHALTVKMMRACLGVKRIEDLWIYHENY